MKDFTLRLLMIRRVSILLFENKMMRFTISILLLSLSLSTAASNMTGGKRATALQVPLPKNILQKKQNVILQSYSMDNHWLLSLLMGTRLKARVSIDHMDLGTM